MSEQTQMFPTAAAFPARASLRNCRLRASAAGIEFTHGGGSTRLAAEDGGIRQALVVPSPGPGGPPNNNSGGSTQVALVSQSSRLVYLLDLNDWLPELPQVALNRHDVVARSGLASVLEESGIPLDEAPASVIDHLTRTADSVLSLPPTRRRNGALFLTRLLFLAVSALGYLGTLASQEGADVGWWALTASVGVFLAAAMDGSVVAVMAWQDRRARRGSVVLRPQPSTVVARGFLDSAIVVSDDAIILRNGRSGLEMHLQRRGANAVTELVVVGPPSSPQWLVLRTATGVSRACLPYDEWLGAAGQGEAVARALAARLEVQATARPSGQRLAVAVAVANPFCFGSRTQGIRDARSGVLLGANSPEPVMSFSALGVLVTTVLVARGLGGHEVVIGLALASTALAASFVRVVVRGLLRKCYWDRPAGSERWPSKGVRASAPKNSRSETASGVDWADKFGGLDSWKK